ncbi:MAG: DUF2062 domain-containing protein [Nitrospiraceae bacterium]
MLSAAAIRSQLRRLLHLNESPHRTALAFAVGTFIAFSPTYGLHTIMVFFCAWAFRLNMVALLAGAFVNNPWTLVPILAATLWVGFQLPGMPDMPPLQWENIDTASLYQHVMPYFVPFVAGGTLLSVVGVLISYPIAYALISYYRRHVAHKPAAARLPHESS